MILGSHDHPQGWLGFFVEQFESFWTPPKKPVCGFTVAG